MGLTRPRAAQIFDIDYKQATRVITVANITVTGGAPAVVDGVSLVLGDRVLVTGQTTASQNGLYDVTVVGVGSDGTWARTSDGNQTGEILAGMIVMVTEGVVYHDTQWKLTTDNPIVIGTTALTFELNTSGNSISNGTSNITVLNNANVNVTVANVQIAAFASTGSYVTGLVSATSNITGGNITTSGQVSVTGNTTAGNILTSGLVSVIGNITGNYFIGNGSQLTGISAGGTPTALVNGTSNVTVASGANTTVGVAGTTVATFDSTGLTLPGIVSATGNITGGNLIAGTGASGNITGANVITANTVTATANIAGGNILTTGAISAAGNITGLNLNSSGADLAEKYVADSDYAPGTVVEFGGTNEITISTQSHSTRVAGIVSTSPGHLMNTNQTGKHVVAVALIGRVPCLVLGLVAKGDLLVTSDMPGHAQRLDPAQYEPGCIIGKALEDHINQEIGRIEVAVGRF